MIPSNISYIKQNILLGTAALLDSGPQVAAAPVLAPVPLLAASPLQASVEQEHVATPEISLQASPVIPRVVTAAAVVHDLTTSDPVVALRHLSSPDAQSVSVLTVPVPW